MASTTEQFNNMTIPKLREELLQRNLRLTAPRKADLVARLVQYESERNWNQPQVPSISTSITLPLSTSESQAPSPTLPPSVSSPSTGRSVTVRTEAELAEAFQALAQAEPITEFIFHPNDHTIPHQIFACLIDLLSASPHLRRFELGGPDRDFDRNVGLEIDQGDIASGLADLIRQNSSLEEMSLRINYNDITLITRALCANQTLRRLTLIDMSDPGAFATLLSVNTPLTHLYLLPNPRCGSPRDDLRSLMRALPFNSHLRELNLGRWFLDQEDLAQSELSWIPPILTQNQTLTQLYLGDDFADFGPEDVDEDTDTVALYQAITSIRGILARNRGETTATASASMLGVGSSGSGFQNPSGTSGIQASSRPSLEGQVVVLSGFRCAELSRRIQARGGEVGTSITRATTMLVIQNPNARTGKVLEAERRGVLVIDRNTFGAQYF